jgi:hypothetical protein
MPLRATLLALLALALCAAPAAAYKAVSAGDVHACALATDDRVVCWGARYHDGATAAPGGRFAELSSGGGLNTCALRLADRSVACWGISASYWPPLPLGPIEAVGPGGTHMCLVVAGDGHIACAGNSDDGKTDPPAGAFKAVAGGYSHTCAIRVDDTVACWGEDWGSGTTSPPGGAFSSLGAGLYHTCGLRLDGAVACWGGNREGQSDAPPGTFTSIGVGMKHACGVRTDGSLTCWGENLWGETVAPPGRFKAVAAGQSFTCGLRVEGSLACWGANFYGQATPPVEPPEPPPITTVALDPPSPDGLQGWYRSPVHLRVSADGGAPGAAVVETRCQHGRQPYPTVMADLAPGCAFLGVGAEITTEGHHFLWAASRDSRSNVEPLVGRPFRIDFTPPTVACSVAPATLWPPNRRLVPIAVEISIFDRASEPEALELLSVTSNQPDQGDAQGWERGVPDVEGLLRAERGRGKARRYTLTYRGTDQAGNTADCTATVAVPARRPAR